MANEPRPPGRPSAHPAPDSYRPRPSARSDTYRPKWAPRDNGYRRGEHQSSDTYRPGQGGRRQQREDVPKLQPVRSAVTKTKHERNTNPSTRIHSLKRQLQTQELPGTIRQERERELAVLLLEQEKIKLRQAAKKNLSRYHFIRFIERQSSERQLKRLTKQRDSCNDESTRNELEKQMHISEVDLNYAKYVPLGDKYVSLFPNEREEKKKKVKFQMNRLDFAVLNEEQQKDVRAEYEQAANVVGNASGVKPPLWYEVEKLMAQGVAQLELLRDGKLTASKQLATNLAVIGGKEDAQIRIANGQELEETTPDWLDDDGIIDQADLDSDQDEDMSDGGFFQR